MANYKRREGKKLSENFNSSEFDCKGSTCGCKVTVIDGALVNVLQKIRNHFGAPLTINSAYRCAIHNKSVGGTSGSKHKLGMAADIVVKGKKPTEVAKYAESIGVKGIGLYDDFVHVDTRSIKSFWKGHNQVKVSTFGGAAKPYSGAFPSIKVMYYTTNSKGKKIAKTRNYLKKNDKGTEVVRLQQFLNWYGNFGLVADGIFGTQTEIAVKSFQTAVKITADGLFGKKALAKAKAVKK